MPCSASQRFSLLSGFSVFLILNPGHTLASVEDKLLEPVVVTGARFSTDIGSAPIGATVITADQIREAGVDNVNQAIRKIGGVFGRASFTGTQDYSLDLRGFGANSNQNMVILIDGIRISENELSSVLLTSVPIELVERIEIVRGGSSVLYGEGATGGTIHVITRRSVAKGPKGTVVAEIGGFDHKELRASLSHGWEGFSVDANLGATRADNYRDNNELFQNIFSGGVQWASAEGRIGFRADAARQNSGLAGSLTLAEFEQNPRQTNTPNDFSSTDTDRYTIFAERKLGALDLAADLSYRQKVAKGVFGTFSSVADSDTWQFSPRLRYGTRGGNWQNEFVAGVDWQKWERVTRSSISGFAFAPDTVSQRSHGVYLRDEVRFGPTRLALGGRHEKFRKAADGFSSYSESQSLNAWELQGSFSPIQNTAIFAKAGKSYRVATADEAPAFMSADPVLEAQTSRDLEMGITVGAGHEKMTMRLFQHRLRNEILFDPTLPGGGANTNLDPTRRRGIEIEASGRLSTTILLSAALQHVNARFTDGPNAGREVVLVPKNLATLRLNWLPPGRHSAELAVNWTDSQRHGGDFANTCSSRMPSFTTIDGRYAVKAGSWEFALIGTNLADKSYFTSAFGDCERGIYPDPGRQVKISARIDF